MPEETAADEEPLLTPAKLLAWRSARAGRPLPKLPPTAILTHQHLLLPRRLPWQRAPATGPFSFEVLHIAGNVFSLAYLRGVGAPGVAVAVEELAAAGVKQVIAVDVCGSIDARLASGGVLVPEMALACDGTSSHYTPEREVRPAPDLTRHLTERLHWAGMQPTEGAVLSTDAVYRETPSMFSDARRQGAVAVDMETACLFAVARRVGSEAAAVLVAADELFDGWRPPADIGRVHAGLRSALAAATACLLP